MTIRDTLRETTRPSTIRGTLGDGKGGVPANALRDRDGNPILDRDGNFIPKRT